MLDRPPQRRTRRKVLSDRMIGALPRKRERYFHPDPELPGHGVRVYPEGPSSYYVIARDAFKKQRWLRLGGTAEMTIEQSRERARGVIRRLKDGLEPFAPPPVKPDTAAAVVATWIKRHVEKNKMRRGHDMIRLLDKHVLPVWRDRPFAEIRRSDIAHLLDAVEDAHGPWIADAVLATLRTVASWHATRNDGYVPPFVKNMRRVPKEERKRSRILSDAELKAVWLTAETEDGAFAAFLRVLFLTTQRREKVATMKWSAISPNGVWTIPSESPREKGHAGKLKLPPAALAIINAQPRFVSNPYVFAGRKPGTPISGFAPWHARFKQRCVVEDWTLHDCRRTARSLLSRCAVLPHVAERTLGHTVSGITAVYDQHDYTAEKADALEKLAALIDTIVRGEPGGNVLPLRQPAPP
jgi:hypothetical protein